MAVVWSTAQPRVEGIIAHDSYAYGLTITPSGTPNSAGVYPEYVIATPLLITADQFVHVHFEFTKDKQDVVDTWTPLWGTASYPMPATSPTFPAYDPVAGTYAVGNWSTYSNVWYRCVSPITTPEAWNAAHWTVATRRSDARIEWTDQESTPMKGVLIETYYIHSITSIAGP